MPTHATDTPSPHPVGVPLSSRVWKPRSGDTPGTHPTTFPGPRRGPLAAAGNKSTPPGCGFVAAHTGRVGRWRDLHTRQLKSTPAG